MSRSNVRSWSMEEVQAWLLQQGPHVAKPEVLESFRANEVDGATLLDLTQEDIRIELQVRSLNARKILWDRVSELQYVEGSRLLKKVVKMQLECSEEDLQHRTLQANPQDDFTQAVHLWQADLQRVQQIMEDAERSSLLQSMEVGREMSAEAGYVAAQELQTHVNQVVELERSDAQVARDVHTARTDAEVARVLQRAQRQVPDAPSTVVTPTSVTSSNAADTTAADVAPSTAASSSSAISRVFQSGATHGAARSMAASSPAASKAASVAASSREPMPEPGPRLNRSKFSNKCNACFEQKAQAESYGLSCKHTMCRDCLAKLFISATSDLTMWPPRCCSQPIDLALAQQVLPLDQKIRFIERSKEANAKNKMYCSNPWCSLFLDLDVVGMEDTKYSCPQCDTLLCLQCRGPAHPELTCQEAAERKQSSAEEQQLLELAGRQGWRRCGRCGVMVQLSSGCNHMTCRCGHHFCYQCGSNWSGPDNQRLCRCELWQEENLIVDVQRQVERREREVRRPLREQEVQEIRHRLQVEEECTHDGWQRNYRHYGSYGLTQECANCGFMMYHYGFQCGQCGDLVCHTCHHHRLN